MMDASIGAELNLGANVELDDAATNGLTPEEKQKHDEALMLELQEIEKEIATLKTVLNTKVKRANDIKRKLGISVWSEMKDSAKTGMTDLKESNAFKNTVQAAQVAKEKTSEVLSSAKEKLSTVTQSTALKSFGERFTNAYSSVKDKLKIGAPGTDAPIGEVQPASEPTTLEEAISADKNNKSPSGATSVHLTAPDASVKK